MDYIDRIRTAYSHAVRDLGGKHGDFVMLSDLRPYIGGHREHVDAALIHLAAVARECVIYPESNQKALTDEDREAALWMGGQHKHTIAFE